MLMHLLGITLDEIIPLAKTIVHSEPLQTLTLSGNFLGKQHQSNDTLLMVRWTDSHSHTNR
jgi:hypothetical protein